MQPTELKGIVTPYALSTIFKSGLSVNSIVMVQMKNEKFVLTN